MSESFVQSLKSNWRELADGGPANAFVLGAASLAEESRSVARGLDWTELRIRRLCRRRRS
jgi:hypothetical protein